MQVKSVSNLPHFPVNYLAVATATVHLELIARQGGDAAFPFTVPAIRTLKQLALAGPVTFFVGENGSGKSTLEGIAAAARLPAVT